jgi:peptidoglycan hydrolase-like protein with peptidoglycan-binding domain
MIRILISTLAIVVATLPGVAGADQLTAIIQQDLMTLGYAPGNTDGEASVETAIAISKFQAENGMDVTGEATPQLAGVIKSKIGQQGQAAPAAAAPAAPAMNAAAQQAAAMQAAQMQAAQMQAAQMQSGMDPAAMQAMMAQMQGGAAMDPAMLQAMQAAQMQGAAGTDPAAAMQVTQAQTAQQACLQRKIAEAQQAQQSAQKRRGFGSLMRAVSRLGGDEIAGSIASATADIAEASATVNDLESAARDLGLTQEDLDTCQSP